MKISIALALAAGIAVSIVDALPEDSPSVDDRKLIVKKDVIVIGAGSSGSYAASKLRRMGKKVAVVERRDRFGGHTATHHVLDSNVTIDYGVQAYEDLDVVRDQFARYDIPVEKVRLTESGLGVANYVDFRNGEQVEGFNYSRDLSAYLAIHGKYPFLHWSTRLPDPVPEDLLLPFGEFLQKNNLEESAYNLFYTTEGLGDLLSQTTLYVLRYLTPAYLEALGSGSGGTLVTRRHYNQELYKKIEREFGGDAFLGSSVLSAGRDKSGVWVLIQTPKGRRLLVAEKLIVAMPPLMSNMEPFKPDRTESSLFSKFDVTGFHAGLVQADGLPENNAYQNTRPDTDQNLPVIPTMYQMSPTSVSGIYLVRYGTEGPLSDDALEGDMLKTFDRVRAVVTKKSDFEPAKFLAYARHYPFNLHVSPKEIGRGFYTKLDDLQGHRSTWYTGAAMISHPTGILWNFTEHLVDRMYR